MIAELGHFALWLALCVALYQWLVPTIGLARTPAASFGEEDGGQTPVHGWVLLAQPAALVQAALVLVAFAALTWSFWVSDFTVRLVADNSHTLKPALYKISGVWGNHEGSLLLWMLMMALSGAAIALWGGAMPAAFRARVLSVQALVSIGFYLFMLLSSNPFVRFDPAPAEGRGLNPLLQDPGLAFHPPMLYAGYVGLSVAFSFAVAALVDGRVSPAWARWMRPWTLAAWAFLTAGLALGSWWAYYELGWGGYWFWDPVENAALMPWLAATALFHSAVVLEKRDALRSWTLLLAVIGFSLSMLGTFIVRSGLLTSVHAFSVDPQRGVFILVLLALYIGGALTLFAIRGPKVEAGAGFRPVSREAALVANNLLLSAALGTVFVGTLYPLVLEAVSGEQISVGPPYFEATFVPLMIPLIILMAIGPFLPWGQMKDGNKLTRRLAIPALLALLAGITALAFTDAASVLALIGFAIAAWLAAAVVIEFARHLRVGEGAAGDVLARLRRLSASNWGVSLAHLGVAFAAFGATAVGALQTETLTTLRVGQSVTSGPYSFRLAEVHPAAGPNYTAIAATLEVSRNGAPVASLHPETRSYTDPMMDTTEAGIASLWKGDLFGVISAPDGNGGWQVRVHWKPFVSALWLGAALMVLGGLISLTDRRLRAGASAPRPARQSDGRPAVPGLNPAE